MMPSIGSERSVSMQTPTTTMRASRGAPSNSCWMMPGTPTHSKISAGLSAGSIACSGGRAAFSASVIAACSAQLAKGCVRAGSITTSAPSFSAMARRAGE